MSDSTPIMEFTSHIDGKNAKVAIWPDRIEWTRHSGAASTTGRWTAATFTLGASLLATGVKGKKDTNVIPIKMVQGVSTHRKGMRYTAVVVMTASDSVEFHVHSKQAEEAKSTIMRLMLERPEITTAPATPATPAAPAAPAAAAAAPTAVSPVSPPPTAEAKQTDVADQLRTLGELHQSGLLTDEEFAAKRAALVEKL
jgi:Short C-terminal domain